MGIIKSHYNRVPVNQAGFRGSCHEQVLLIELTAHVFDTSSWDYDQSALACTVHISLVPKVEESKPIFSSMDVRLM